MKKWISLLFAAVLMLFVHAGWTSAAAQKSVPAPPVPKLYLNGKALAAGAPPALVRASVLVPIRTVAENLGYKVGWDGKKKQVSVKEGSTEILMKLGDPKATVNGKPVTLTEPPQMQSDTTLIPIRFVGETFGLQIMWDNETKSAFLYTDAAGEAGGNGSGSAAASDGGNGTNPGTGQGSGGTDAGSNVGSGAAGGAGASGGGLIGVVEPEDGGGAAGGTQTPGTADPAGGFGTNGGSGNSGGSQGTGQPAGSGNGVSDPIPATASLHQIYFATDTVVLAASGTVVPVTNVLSGPDRIVVDLPNTSFADDFSAGISDGITPFVTVNQGKPEPGQIPALSGIGHEALSQIRYSQYSDSPATVRVVLDLNQPWGFEIASADGQIMIRLKNTAPAPKSGYTVVLDAGHGGTDPGARSLSGKWEKDFTLSVVKKIQAILSNAPKINLVLTRGDDSYPSLDDRVNLANSLQADLFLSIHGNSYTAATNGTETYYTSSASLAFARLLHQNALAATGFKDNGVRTANYKVTRATTMPSVLLEVGYLTNASNEKAMYDDAFQDRVAAAVAASIRQYFNLS